MNREQRRRAKKQAPAWGALTPEQRKERLFKNGITREDVDREWKRGFEEGFRKGTDVTFETLFAAVALALRRDKLHLGYRRIARILNAADQITMTLLDTQEAIQQVWGEVGLHLEFNDPFERVKTKD